MSLLNRVAEHKMIYFAQGWAKYNEARPGSLRLVPTKQQRPALKRDYAQMRDMIFGDIPGFEEIIAGLRRLESRINGGGVTEHLAE